MLASDGSTLPYDASVNTSYQKRVAVIGRDDTSGFNQTTSRTQDSDDDILVIENPSDLEDNEWVSWADDNKQKTTKEFEEVAQIFQKLRSQYFSNNPKFNQISMGMSGDYKIAVKSGSTMVRIGSLLFGDR